RAVVVAMHFGPFEHAVVVAQGYKLFHRDETVVFVGLFAASGRAGGAGNRQGDVAVLFQQGIDKAGLTGPAGGHYHKNIAVRHGVSKIGEDKKLIRYRPVCSTKPCQCWVGSGSWPS